MATKTRDNGELEAIIARTALKYDLLPYESKPFAMSQPARLGALARLFGLEAAPLAKARVLELGCASGGNIIPHAARYPDAQFVGVDLARTQVAAGRARIERMGLNNIEILCKSFTEIGEELGTFDYIICHGVYSWVPPQVQDAIMKVIRARLSPVGVACVSYNVLPGWRMMQPLRDAFLLAVPDGVDSLGRVRMAREMLEFMAKTSPDKGPYGETLRNWAQRLASLPDDYIAHEFLEECNDPSLIRDFANAAAVHGLGYLGECELSAMILDNYGQELAEGVRARGGSDLVASEQWLDILSGRTFRQSLLIANERMAGVNRALSPDSIAALHFVLPAGCKVARDGDATTFTAADGRLLSSTLPSVGGMLEKMAQSFPASTNVAALTEGAEDQARAEMLDALYRMAMTGLLYLQSEPVPCATNAGDKPRASLVARSDAEAGAGYTTSLRHETVALDPGAQALLPSLDGTNGKEELEAALLEATQKGALSFARDGNAITDAKELKSAIAELLPNLLVGISAAGLIEAEGPALTY
ncbi:methyltransferase regulatory domain-containing protein [Novosphingobium sp. TH158]|uniref:methyltransferase regulatory domain-containing protein n=1 Tax=Novosphingobium sp. TH158 TaxID=2067455 RepID=UPI000C7C43CC|nr:class I SAM-dependent methyltransferase [Novosphingobium sp. TH158]PLK26052.1 methyltransferase [Novosphingobium sp. TH158]